MLGAIRNRSPAAQESAPESKKQRIVERASSVTGPAHPPTADDSEDEKSDQDLVVDEVADVSNCPLGQFITSSCLLL